MWGEELRILWLLFNDAMSNPSVRVATMVFMTLVLYRRGRIDVRCIPGHESAGTVLRVDPLLFFQRAFTTIPIELFQALVIIKHYGYSWDNNFWVVIVCVMVPWLIGTEIEYLSMCTDPYTNEICMSDDWHIPIPPWLARFFFSMRDPSMLRMVPTVGKPREMFPGKSGENHVT